MFVSRSKRTNGRTEVGIDFEEHVIDVIVAVDAIPVYLTIALVFG